MLKTRHINSVDEAILILHYIRITFLCHSVYLWCCPDHIFLLFRHIEPSAPRQTYTCLLSVESWGLLRQTDLFLLQVPTATTTTAREGTDRRGPTERAGQVSPRRAQELFQLFICSPQIKHLYTQITQKEAGFCVICHHDLLHWHILTAVWSF